MRFQRLSLVCLSLVMISTVAFTQIPPKAPSLGLNTILGTGARAQGMGGAFTAIADDATAASWNPAGLAQLTRPEFSLVWDQLKLDTTTAFLETTELQNLGRVDETIVEFSEGDYSDVGFASVTFPFNVVNRSLVGELSYRRLSTFPEVDTVTGFSVVARDLQNRVVLEETGETLSVFVPDGSVDSYSLSLATGLTPKLNLGVSVNYMRGDFNFGTTFVDLTNDFLFVDAYEFSYNAIAFDVGLLYKFTDWLSAGAVWHSGFDTSVDTRNVFAVEGLSSVSDFRLDSDLTWPHGYAVGLAFRPAERLTFAVDYSSTQWSKGEISDFAYADFDCSGATCVPIGSGFRSEGDPAPPFPVIFAVQQRDTSSLRAGGEYIFALGKVLLPIRAGYFTEEQLINLWDTFDVLEEQPDYDGWSAGAGFVWNRFQVDFAYSRTEGSDVGAARTISDFIIVEGQRVNFTTQIPRRSIDTTLERYLVSLILRF